MDSSIQTLLPLRILSNDLDPPTNATTALVDAIISANLPFNFVANESFKRFVELVKKEPDFKVPHRTRVGGALLHERYRTVVDNIKRIARKCSYLSITTDGWTGPKAQSYWSLTFHMLDKNFDFHTVVAGCMPVYHRHTAENLATYIKKKLEEFGVDVTKIVGIVTDEGGAAPCIVDHFPGCETIHCSGHVLQTILKNAFCELCELHPFLDPLLVACRSIVSLYRSSTAFKAELDAKMINTGENLSSLIADVITRWNSKLAMAKSLITHKSAIVTWLSENEDRDARVNFFCLRYQSNWIILDDIVAILTPFQEVTSNLSVDNSPTLHRVIPLILGLKGVLFDLRTRFRNTVDRSSHKIAITFIDVLLKQIENSIENWTPAELMAFALAPENHISGDQLPENWLVYMEQGFEEIVNRIPAISPLQAETPAPTGSQTPVIAWLAGIQQRSINHNQGIHEEIAHFRILAKDNKPALEFWRGTNTLPHLKTLAMKILCIPATQTTSEREFSLMGRIISELRTNLDPETAEKLLVASWSIRRANHSAADIKDKARTNTSDEKKKNMIASARLTRFLKRSYRLGDYVGGNTTFAMNDPQPAESHNQTTSKPMNEFAIDEEDLYTLSEVLGNGENEDDADFMDSRLATEDITIGALETPTHTMKPPGSTNRSLRVKPMLILDTSATFKDKFVAFVHNLTHPLPPFTTLMGHLYDFFEGYEMTSGNQGVPCFTFTFSSKGFKELPRSRKAALRSIGEIHCINLA